MCAGLLFVSLFSLAAQSASAQDANRQRELEIFSALMPEFAEIEPLVFQADSPAQPVIDRLQQEIGSEPDSQLDQRGLVRRSSLLFLQALVEIFRAEDKRAARATLSRARELAERLVEEYPGALSYRILGDIAAQDMLLYPGWQIVSRAPEVQGFAEQALEYDPTEAGASMLIAYGRVNAPRLFGGDPEEAREIFAQVLESSNLMSSQRFSALVGMAQALEKLDQAEAAEEYRRQARQLFPKHWEFQ